MIKGHDDYQDNKRKNDVLWIIKHARQLTSGDDNEADSVDIYVQALWEWIHIRQGENESEDSYQKRADTATHNLVLAGGEDVLYPRKLFPSGTSDINNPKEDEKRKLMDRIRAMHLLCRSDFKRHGKTVDELRKAQDLGRSEWPTTQPSGFKLLVKRAGNQQQHKSPNKPGGNKTRFGRQGAQFLQQNNVLVCTRNKWKSLS